LPYARRWLVAEAIAPATSSKLRWLLERTSVADTPPMPRQRPQRLGLSS